MIIEEEQQGKQQATYGTYVIKELSDKLSKEYGRGFDQSNLRRMRRFYLTFPIGALVQHELSWTHYKILIRVINEAPRNWYMNEAADFRLDCIPIDLSFLRYEHLRHHQD